MFILLVPYLLEVHYYATFLHHGVLLVMIHQVSQGVEPLTSAHVILTILLETNVNNSTTRLRRYQSANHALLKEHTTQCAGLSHLVAYHNMCHLGLAVHILMFLLIGEN